MLKHGRDACPIGRVPAGEIEGAVIDQPRVVLRLPEIVVGTWRATHDQDDGITAAEVTGDDEWCDNWDHNARPLRRGWAAVAAERLAR